jgi:hypothetical protein
MDTRDGPRWNRFIITNEKYIEPETNIKIIVYTKTSRNGSKY